MATRAVIEFGHSLDHGEAGAAVYVHYDGYPEGIIPLLRTFREEVRRQTRDTRETDPQYYAAKLIVFLARILGTSGLSGELEFKNPLDFLGVGVAIPGEDYGQDYTYRLVNGDVLHYTEGWVEHWDEYQSVRLSDEPDNGGLSGYLKGWASRGLDGRPL